MPFNFEDIKRFEFNNLIVIQSQSSRNPFWSIIDVYSARHYCIENHDDLVSYCMVFNLNHNAYSIYNLPQNIKVCVLRSVNTLKKYRKMGYCEKMLRNIFEILKRDKYEYVFLETHIGNYRAINLYRKLGFNLWTSENMKNYKKDIWNCEQEQIPLYVKNLKDYKGEEEYKDFIEDNSFLLDKVNSEVILMIKKLTS